MNENNEFASILQDADSVVVLVEVGRELHLYYSSELDENTVLDRLSLVTSQLYHTLDSNPNLKH